MGTLIFPATLLWKNKKKLDMSLKTDNGEKIKKIR
jgi:hypothetical protein